MTDKNLIKIDRLIFVYNADSGLLGAVIDSARKLLAIKGCALCSITHAITGEKDEWKTCKEELGVPIDYVHRDNIPSEIRPVVGNNLPCVVAKAGDRYYLLLNPSVLQRCRGSVADLKGRLLFHASVQGLQLSVLE